MQLTLHFERNINKPWWMGLVCQPMHYFDLLKQGVNIEELMKTWEIEDYKKTKEVICQDGNN